MIQAGTGPAWLRSSSGPSQRPLWQDVGVELAERRVRSTVVGEYPQLDPVRLNRRKGEPLHVRRLLGGEAADALPRPVRRLRADEHLELLHVGVGWLVRLLLDVHLFDTARLTGLEDDLLRELAADTPPARVGSADVLVDQPLGGVVGVLTRRADDPRVQHRRQDVDALLGFEGAGRGVAEAGELL